MNFTIEDGALEPIDPTILLAEGTRIAVSPTVKLSRDTCQIEPLPSGDDVTTVTILSPLPVR